MYIKELIVVKRKQVRTLEEINAKEKRKKMNDKLKSDQQRKRRKMKENEVMKVRKGGNEHERKG